MKESFSAPTFQWSFLHPRYALTWLGIFMMFLLSWLPYRIQRFLGKNFGQLLLPILKKRRFIAERNLQLCFPEMTKAEREHLVIKNFENTGFAFFETCMAWFWPAWRIKKHIKYVGFENLELLNQTKKGTMILAVHNLNLELSARAFGLIQPGYGVYRPHTNPVFEWAQVRGRCRENHLIHRNDTKAMIRKLKKGEILWYAPDHDYGHHRYVWAPFFAVDKACTTTGTHFLAAVSKCNVATFTISRDDKGCGYTVTLDPIEKDFPVDTPQACAEFTNHLIERSIMRAPEQYMWLHRRFKSRPEGEPSLYD